MALSAILRAGGRMFANHGRREPIFGVAPGNDVALHAHVGHVEIVQHVFAGHDQMHRFIHRHVDFVDAARSVRILELPQPFLGGNLDFHRIARANGEFHVADNAPEEQSDTNEDRDDGPDDFEARVVRLVRRGAPRHIAVTPGEVRHREHDSQKQDDAQPQDRHVHEVDLFGEFGALWRQ